MLNHYNTELEGMRAFYDELGYPPEKIDYRCSTDGRLRIHNKLGSLNEFKINATSPLAVFEQMKRYVYALNAKAIDLPKYGVYICINQKKYQVFLLDTDDFDRAKATELLDWNTPEDIRNWMEDTSIQLGWIDRHSLVAYNDRYFQTNPRTKTKTTMNTNEAVQKILSGQKIDADRKSKDQFIAELIKPTVLHIKPYQWNEDGIMERSLLDCIGSKELRKRLGAFFTPEEYARKSAEYIRRIITERTGENDEVLIVDRCAGTGNLEESLLSVLKDIPQEKYTILASTIVFAERMSLEALLSENVDIFPDDITADENGLLIHGDALTEEFNNALVERIEAHRLSAQERGHNLITIFYENPPYGEPQAEATRSGKTQKGTTNNWLTQKMKAAVKGTANNDLANKFIWSAFNIFNCEYYVVYSPIKYWKSQHLISKKFLYGFIADRYKFHATEAGISVIAWENSESDDEKLELENKTVYKVHKGITELLPKEDAFNEYDILMYHGAGTPDFKHGYLVSSEQNIHLSPKKLRIGEGLFSAAIPLFVANCYEPQGYLEKEIIFKSGDGGMEYLNDSKFLMDCFVWCGLSDKNKCVSNDDKLNQYCFCQNTKADELLGDNENSPDYVNLFNKWKDILREASDCDEKNPEWTYGLYQLDSEVNITGPLKDENENKIIDKTGKQLTGKMHERLDADITIFKRMLRSFYHENIEPKLFDYQLLK